MNVGTNVTPSPRGQIVIPANLRNTLGIDHNTILNLKVVGDGIYMQPMKIVPVIRGDNGAFLALLKRIQGSWGPETPEEKKLAKAQRKLELAASRISRNAW